MSKCACCENESVTYCADRDAWVCLEHYLPQEQAPWAAKVTQLTAENERLKGEVAEALEGLKSLRTDLGYAITGGDTYHKLCNWVQAHKDSVDALIAKLGKVKGENKV